MAGTNNAGKLSDKGMIHLAKRWLSIHREKKELKMFQQAIGVKNITQARAKWKQYETWVPFFYAFWDTIKEQYSTAGIWEKEEHYYLLYIVTMHAMQDMFIEAKSEGDARFSTLDDFKSQVAEYFKDVPPTFFQGWKRTGLQSGDGPRYIRKAIKMLRDGNSLRTVHKESELFKELEKASAR